MDTTGGLAGATTAQNAAVDVTAAVADDGDGAEEYETILLEGLSCKKAYGSVEANVRHALCLFDSAFQGDRMSWAFYKRCCKRQPLALYRGTVRGFNNSRSTPQGTANVCTTYGGR